MTTDNNIFLFPFDTPHGYIPFDRISKSDYEPAILEGIRLHDKEVDDIASLSDTPTFENTILALERSGKTLDRVLNVFFPMLSACSDDDMMALSQKLAPVIAEHANNITLNERLWKRVKHVYDHFQKDAHDQEDWMLLKKTYNAFEQNGATLEGDDREKFRALSKRLTELSLTFEQNHLKETNKYVLWLTENDLDGLPESAVEAAALAAKEKGREGEYLITLHAPSYGPFMKFSKRRDLREKLYKLYNQQCTQGEHSNVEVVKDIANARLEMARLFGCESFAQHRLKLSMAQTPQAVMKMLGDLKAAYHDRQAADMKALNEFADQMEGQHIDIMPWDYAYYSRCQHEALFHFNSEDLRPYFNLEDVSRGVFGLATKLYGLQFTETHEAPVFHPEVHVYDVTDRNGKYIGSIYTDFFPRDTKQSGAWMTNFREQWRDEHGNDIRPLVTLTMNFTRPTETKPSLLTYGEVNTFIHEFGHGLHSLLSRCKYVSTSGTNVFRDFVELPSQFHENFLRNREYLNTFAKHYQTGEPIPEELMNRLMASQQHGAAYACMRQLSFGLLDMAWHSITEPYTGDTATMERQAMKPVQIFEPVDGCFMSPQFGHIFSGGYAAGYYGYKWAEVLDADAFSMFEENGIFDPDTAQRFHDCILSRGSSDEPMTLYKNFRGREPKIDALLRRDGITAPSTSPRSKGRE